MISQCLTNPTNFIFGDIFQNLQKVIEQTGVKGFADVVVSDNITSGICHL